MSQGGKLEREGAAATSKYVVDHDGSGDYTTIQAAINAANADGGGLVYVRDGVYTENLICYNNVFVRGENILVSVVGLHSPPLSGTIKFANLSLQSSTHIFDDITNAGTSDVIIEDCYFNLTSGFVLNLPNWMGDFSLYSCYDNSIDNGIINNIGGSGIIIKDCIVGKGTINTAIITGITDISDSKIDCKLNFQSSADVTIDNCLLKKNVTTTASVIFDCYNSTLETGSDIALTTNSIFRNNLSNVTIDTSATYAISGNGSIAAASMNFIKSDGIDPNVNVNRTPPHTIVGEINAQNIERMEFSGRYSWSGSGNYYSILGPNFTVIRGGIAYVKGIRRDWASNQTISLSTNGVTYYVYMDTTGNIQQTTTRSLTLFEENTVLFEVLRDSLGNFIVVKEDHPYEFPTRTSEWAHNTIGSVIENINGGANIVLNGTKAIQINGTDYLADHGLRTTIPDSAGSPVSFYFMYTNGVGKWTLNTTTTLFPSSYNNAGTITALSANKFGVFRLYVSKDDLNSSIPKYFAVFDTQQYNNLFLANSAIDLDTVAKASAELEQLELAQLGFVVKEQSTDTIVAVRIAKETVVSGITSAAPASASTVTTSTTNFDSWLSAADTNVQVALETLDDLGKGFNLDSGGDVGIKFYRSTTFKWYMGIDSPTDDFKISQSSTFGTKDFFIMSLSGVVQTPNQIAFLAEKGTIQFNQTGTGTVAKVTFDSERYDQGTGYNAGTSVFTAFKTSRYLFTYSFAFSDIINGNSLFTRLVTSNRNYTTCYLNPNPVLTSSRFGMPHATFADMDIGDTAYVVGSVSGEASDIVDYSQEAYFGGILIS